MSDRVVPLVRIPVSHTRPCGCEYVVIDALHDQVIRQCPSCREYARLRAEARQAREDCL